MPAKPHNPRKKPPVKVRRQKRRGHSEDADIKDDDEFEFPDAALGKTDMKAEPADG